MKIYGIIINGNFIGQVLLGIFTGWLFGLLLRYINLFGSSQNAPLGCAVVAGFIAIGKLIMQQKNNSNISNQE